MKLMKLIECMIAGVGLVFLCWCVLFSLQLGLPAAPHFLLHSQIHKFICSFRLGLARRLRYTPSLFFLLMRGPTHNKERERAS